MLSVCVIGLGYIGLPTAAMFALAGKTVVGVDVQEAVVRAIAEGRLHIEEPGLLDAVLAANGAGTLRTTMMPEVCDAYIIAVPTPVRGDHSADMSAVSAAAKSLVDVIRPGCLVVLESTSPPGTTTNLVQPILEESGLKAGKDFMLCYSPERVLPGNILNELVYNDRVIGGVTPESSEVGKELYSSFVKGAIMVTDSTTAEAVKVMENTYRDVNIALANEFALIADAIGFNVWEAVRLANHHPRVNILKPGPGVGGHCVAVDPWFLVEAAPAQARLISLAREVNDWMPHYIAQLVTVALDQESPSQYKVACLGLTFKANVDDVRESPAMQIVELLAARGYRVSAYDPHVSLRTITSPSVTETLEGAIDGAHLLLVLVDHDEFKHISPSIGLSMASKIAIDTRNLWDAVEWRASGFCYYALGEPLAIKDPKNRPVAEVG